MKKLNEILREHYLDWVNNYTSIELFAEHNEISVQQANDLVQIGHDLHEEHCSTVNDYKINTIDTFLVEQRIVFCVVNRASTRAKILMLHTLNKDFHFHKALLQTLKANIRDKRLENATDFAWFIEYNNINYTKH